ncbi:MAG TPA: hypothetical protein VGD17_18820 [Chitinophagaceae bacterium]
MSQIKSIKWIIFRNNLLLPILLGVILLIEIFYPQFPITTGSLVAWFIIFVIRLLLSDNKYLTSFEVEKEVIAISYLTPLLLKRSILIPVEEVVNAEFQHRSFLENCDYFILTTENEKYDLRVVTEELKSAIKSTSGLADLSQLKKV